MVSFEAGGECTRVAYAKFHQPADRQLLGVGVPAENPGEVAGEVPAVAPSEGQPYANA